MPSGLKGIGDEIFGGCTSLKNIDIPNGVVIIGKHAFRNCTSLVSITIPDSVTALGLSIDYVYPDRLPISKDEPKYGVFDGCTNLQSISYKGKTYGREHIGELYKAING